MQLFYIVHVSLLCIGLSCQLFGAASTGLAAATNYLGCYVEQPGRLLIGYQENFPDTLTPDVCVALCLQKGFHYAGAQYRVECFCSKRKPPDDKKTDEGQCDLKCSGDDSKYCGGTNRLSVYKTGIEDKKGLPINYLGCYVEQPGRLLNDYQENYLDTLTPDVCIALCLQKGFLYAGTQYRVECFCSKRRPPDNKKAEEEQCDLKCSGDDSSYCGGTNRLSVYKTGIEDKKIPAPVVTAANYIGCYIEIPGTLLNGLKQNYSDSLTPDVCINECHRAGFAFAGAQYSIECFCSEIKPAIDKKTEDDQCDMKCSGDDSKYCGGTNRISVYRTGAKEINGVGLATAANYLGCYIEIQGRLLNGHQQLSIDSLTPGLCVGLCQHRGFAYAGAQLSVECFCSKTKPSDDKKTEDGQCDMKCSGDDSKICGGTNRISVFRTGIEEKSDSNYMGCYIEISGRLLSGYRQDFPDSLTPNVCTALCRQKGFAYAGTQYRVECFCSKTKPPDDKKTEENQCDMNCSGDGLKFCGGTNRISVYRTGVKEDVANSTENMKYIGCFREFTNGTHLMAGFRQDFPHTLTNEQCAIICKKRGYKYAGMQVGKECYCDNNTPSYMDYVSDEDCNMRCDGNALQLCGGNFRLSVFFTGIPGSSATYNAGKYIGCFKDINSPRHLSGYEEKFGNGLSLLKCTGLCYAKGFLYAGTQNSNECYCGDEHPSPNLKTSEDDCSSPCSGEPTNKCGGSFSNSIRETGITDYPADDKFLGCFNDTYNQIYRGRKMLISLTNSPRRCFNICMQLGFKYSGVEYGMECFCGDQAPSRKLAVSGDECNMICSGDPLESCGSAWRLAVSLIDLIGTVQPVINIPSTMTTTAVTDRTCIQSYTTVNGQTVCRGDVIFADEFKTPLGNKWKNVVIIPESPDNEFIVLHADSRNCFVSKNNLVIKPTLFNDSFVQSGLLRLEGCTGALGTRECGYNAFSFNILPPVASARINTRHSFTFRYGVVEIRAKLPVGDWLVPELWLEPKDHQPGAEYYETGRIRLAVCRGNEQLNCTGDTLGTGSLESGIVMGPANDVRSRYVHSTVPDNWHDYFHTYTLTWKPGSISFKIDNEDQKELIPPGQSLCQLIGFNYQQCALWGTGSTIAPFDKEFYISLGLSAGNSRDFPDKCLNRGRQKPWRNWEVKAMLKFWQDKSNWMSTWSDERSSLLVEYVRVTAL